MSEQDREDGAFERRSKAWFDTEVEGLDGRTRSRLAQARHRALAHGRRPPLAAWLGGPRALLPAGAAAAVVLAMLVLWRLPAPGQPAPEVAALQDLEILLGDEELEMLEELEFYAWLEEQPEFTAPEPTEG